MNNIKRKKTAGAIMLAISLSMSGCAGGTASQESASSQESTSSARDTAQVTAAASTPASTGDPTEATEKTEKTTEYVPETTQDQTTFPVIEDSTEPETDEGRLSEAEALMAEAAAKAEEALRRAQEEAEAAARAQAEAQAIVDEQARQEALEAARIQAEAAARAQAEAEAAKAAAAAAASGQGAQGVAGYSVGGTPYYLPCSEAPAVNNEVARKYIHYYLAAFVAAGASYANWDCSHSTSRALRYAGITALLGADGKWVELGYSGTYQQALQGWPDGSVFSYGGTTFTYRRVDVASMTDYANLNVLYDCLKVPGAIVTLNDSAQVPPEYPNGIHRHVWISLGAFPENYSFDELSYYIALNYGVLIKPGEPANGTNPLTKLYRYSDQGSWNIFRLSSNSTVKGITVDDRFIAYGTGTYYILIPDNTPPAPPQPEPQTPSGGEEPTAEQTTQADETAQNVTAQETESETVGDIEEAESGTEEDTGETASDAEETTTEEDVTAEETTPEESTDPDETDPEETETVEETTCETSTEEETKAEESTTPEPVTDAPTTSEQDTEPPTDADDGTIPETGTEAL